MNNINKGKYIRDYAKKMLENQGYVVERCHKAIKWINGKLTPVEKDFFGCVDLIALRHNDKVRFIQVTLDSGIENRRKKFKNVGNWNFSCCSVELWQKKQKGWRMFRLQPDYVLKEITPKQLVL